MSPGFIGNFYFRRAMRLLPLYYAAVALLLIACPSVRATWFYYALYAVNLLFWQTETWGIGAHFWSLAVEEQFYLIWPFAVLCLPRRSLIALCWVLIVAGLQFRIALRHDPFAAYLLPGCIDQLAAGALLALSPPLRLSNQLALPALLSGALAIFCWRMGDRALIYSAALPGLVLLVSAASQGISGGVGIILSNPVLRYLGGISYGLYVIHWIVWWMLHERLQAFDPYLCAAIYMVITIALAALSWHHFEGPINRFRDYFTTQRDEQHLREAA